MCIDHYILTNIHNIIFVFCSRDIVNGTGNGTPSPKIYSPNILL